MGERVPAGVYVVLIVASWSAGRLLGGATGSMLVVIVAAGTVVLGGYVLAARNWPAPEDPDAETYGLRRTASVVWLGTLVVVYEIGSLIAWPDAPRWGKLSADEVLAPIAAIPVVPIAQRWIAVARRNRDQRVRRARSDRRQRAVRAARTARPADDEPAVFVVGYRQPLLAGIALIALGLAALGVWLLAAGGDATATRVWACALLLGSLAIGARDVIPRFRRPDALRIDAGGIDIGGRGAVPWAAVDRVALLTLAGVMRLTVSLKDDLRANLRRTWMTPPLRRALKYHGNSLVVSVGLLDTDVATLAVTLERHGHPPAIEE